jgi:excisionase family DNA binding protein
MENAKKATDLPEAAQVYYNLGKYFMSQADTTERPNVPDGGQRLTFTVPEVAALLGLSRNGAYEAVATGQIPSIRIGRRLLVPRVALERMLAGTTDGTGEIA